MQQYAEHYLEQWKQTHLNPATVASAYETHHAQLAAADDVAGTQAKNQAALVQQAHAHGFGAQHKLDTDIENKVERLIKTNQQQVSTEQATVEHDGQQRRDSTRTEVAKKPHY